MSEVTARSTNKIVMVLVIALVVAAGLFFFLRSGDSVTEEMVVNRAKEEMALVKPFMDMQAEKITADVGRREITYTNVTMKLPQTPEFLVAIDKVVQGGIDADSYAGNPGDLTSIDIQSVQGLKLLMQGQTVMTIDEYVYEGMKLNYRDLLKVLRENQMERPEKILVKLMPVLSSYHLERGTAKNFKFDFMFVDATIDSMEGKDMSMASYGAWSLSNMQVNAMGQKVFSMDKMGGAGVIMPKIITEMMADPEGYVKNNPDMVHKANTDPLSVLAPMQLKDIYIENMMIDAGSPLMVKRLTGDLDISDAALVIKSSVSDLVITRQLISMHPDLIMLADVVKSDLHLNGLFDFSLGNKTDPVDVAMRVDLNESNLGGMNMDIAMDMPRDELYGGYSNQANQRLKSFEFTAENKGIIDFLVACYAALEYSDYDAVYGEMLDELYLSLESAESNIQRDAANAMIKLVEEGGTLKMSLKPAAPVSLDKLNEASDADFERMGGSITYMPLNQQ